MVKKPEYQDRPENIQTPKSDLPPTMTYFFIYYIERELNGGSFGSLHLRAPFLSILL